MPRYSKSFSIDKLQHTNYSATPADQSSKEGENLPLMPDLFMYQDHSQVSEEAFKSIEAEMRETKSNRGHVKVPFPLKLHEMLEEVEAEGLSSVVSWQTHGRAFLVHKPHAFVTNIMRRFFRQSKYTSFQRQLNLYGFKRLTLGPDTGAYYHEYFLRGKPFLYKGIIRTKLKCINRKAKGNPEIEPNLYDFPPLTHSLQDDYIPVSRLNACAQPGLSQIEDRNIQTLKLNADSENQHMRTRILDAHSDLSFDTEIIERSENRDTDSIEQEIHGTICVLSSFGGKAFHFLDFGDLPDQLNERISQKQNNTINCDHALHMIPTSPTSKQHVNYSRSSSSVTSSVSTLFDLLDL